jgi:ABC-type phosphate transport system permease subunit
MENQIIKTTGNIKSILLSEKELWISEHEIKDFESFKKAVQGVGVIDGTIYKLIYFSQIQYNEESETVKLVYKVGSMVSKLRLNFESKNNAAQFAESLGTRLELKRSEGEEKKIGPLVYNLIYVLIAAVVTIFLGNYDGTVGESSSRKSRLGRAILQILYDTIGQVGLIIIGTLVTLFFVYKLYKRFKQPVNDVTFKKK